MFIALPIPSKMLCPQHFMENIFLCFYLPMETKQCKRGSPTSHVKTNGS